MAPLNSKAKKTPSSQSTACPIDFPLPLASGVDYDDDFQDPVPCVPLALTQTTPEISYIAMFQSLKPSDPASMFPPSKRPKHQSVNLRSNFGKENFEPVIISMPYLPSSSENPMDLPSQISTRETTATGYFSCANESHEGQQAYESDMECGLDLIESTIDRSYRASYTFPTRDSSSSGNTTEGNTELKMKTNYLSNSMESRLFNYKFGRSFDVSGNLDSLNLDNSPEFESGTQLDVLLKLCSELNDLDDTSDAVNFHHPKEFDSDDCHIQCPLCGTDISDLSDELRQVHTNECLDKVQTINEVACPNVDSGPQGPGQVLDDSTIQFFQRGGELSPVIEWLRSLSLAKYEEIFIREEIDWEALQCLTEEDLYRMGVTALGPRKKIVRALGEIRKEDMKMAEIPRDASKVAVSETNKLVANKLITDYIPGYVTQRRSCCSTSGGQKRIGKSNTDSHQKQALKNNFTNRKYKDIPAWCCIPGTPFRVDAFKYLRRDCSHWFLTHFHADHYGGLTKSFCHGKIYCSSITARLVNLKIGIPWDDLQILPLNQKICIAGTDVTCFDANHCPGSIIILFQPPNGKAVLHTGDFRFGEEMAKLPNLQTCSIHTLILDTTYCNPQYDFPKQEAVVQFVIEAIQAEAFNPKTLFLIGSYTIGKERLFLEVARVLRKKVYITASKLRILQCLGLSSEDMQWFTLHEEESQIHVVPMWSLANFKRLKYVSDQYAGRYSLIVAFSPTGWSFGKGRKKSPGRRWQQGTIIRYEVPYSEHCSFTELKDFVKFISPVNIIPSVNNRGPESARDMISLLLG